MSMKNKIKEAFSKSKSIREANKWDPDSQPNLYELYNFLRKAGYRLISADIINGGVPELLIEPVESNHLYPDISYDASDKNFYVHVQEHGLVILSDLEEIMKGYENAAGVLSHLNSLDLDELEIEEE